MNAPEHRLLVPSHVPARAQQTHSMMVNITGSSASSSQGLDLWKAASLPLPSSTAGLYHTTVFYGTSCRTLHWQARESQYKTFPALCRADGRTGNYTAKTQPTALSIMLCIHGGALGRTEGSTTVLILTMRSTRHLETWWNSLENKSHLELGAEFKREGTALGRNMPCAPLP